MLIEFTVGNYLSIKDKQTLRMDASSITEYQDRLIDAGRYKLLRSAVIYGANASGKSNVLKAMATMREIITTSAAQSSTATIPVEPFLLSTETEHAPSYFEMLFLLDGVRYRYGFEADKDRVHAEWLFEQKKLKEKALFVREGDSIEVGTSFKEGKGLEERTSSNKIFLAICDQFNSVTAKKIIVWLNSAYVVSGLTHESQRSHSLSFLDSLMLREAVFRFLKRIDLGFSDLSVVKEAYEDGFLNFVKTVNEPHYKKLLEGQPKSAITTHTKYNSKKEAGCLIEFDLFENESSGTIKLMDLIGPMFTSLFSGRILIIDELDAKLHPLLTKEIINMFNNSEINTQNSQLIFATHDTNLLSCGQFRRDQIYFTEKDKYGSTSLYSLVEYKEDNGSTVRKDRSFEKDYIEGRYGAIPYIGDFSKLFS